MTVQRRALALGATLLIFTACLGAQGPGPTFTTLYQFRNSPDAATPNGLLIGSERQGLTVLYGTATGGGSTGVGATFSLSSPSSPGGSWTEALLYSFAGGDDGAVPTASVTLATGGVLYGSTYRGGGTQNDGTVFSLTAPPTQGGPWSETVLYNFPAYATNGFGPQAPLVIGSGGVLYGVVVGGGPSNNGLVYSLTPPASPGGAWTETVLHNFSGASDGYYPTGLTIGKGPGGRPILYGTTWLGGTSNFGTAFALSPPTSAGGSWSMTVLHSFAGGPGDGASPNMMVLGSGPGGQQVLYGTTLTGGSGSHCPNGCGTVFSLAPPSSAGGAWTEAVLYNFEGGKQDGASPFAGLAVGRGGVLYGTTSSGGSSNAGMVYSLTRPASPGGAWTEAVLHDFSGGPDGADPISSLVVGADGAIYGTTSRGGTYLAGTVFLLLPVKSAP